MCLHFYVTSEFYVISSIKMADLQTNIVEEDVHDIKSKPANVTGMKEEMFDCLNGVSHLLLTARLQAREADIRARYAKQYADRAITEARSAHQVSEALANTARVVASIALEFANRTDTTLESDDCRGLIGERETESAHEIGASASDEGIFPRALASQSDAILYQNQPRNTKYCDSFPPDLPPLQTDLHYLKISPSLPTVWEGSPSADGDDAYADSDVRRKMQIYKDSKSALGKAFEIGDSHTRYAPHRYIDSGMQTVPVSTLSSAVQ